MVFTNPLLTALSKRGLGPKGANWARKGLFRAISALPRGCEVRSHQRRLPRHRVNGVGQGGGQAILNHILTRFYGIQLKSGQKFKSGQNPVKIRSKSLEIVCVQRYKAYPERAEKAKSASNPAKSVRPHLRTTPFAQL